MAVLYDFDLAFILDTLLATTASRLTPSSCQLPQLFFDLKCLILCNREHLFDLFDVENFESDCVLEVLYVLLHGLHLVLDKTLLALTASNLVVEIIRARL